jgi:hypothetical protein
MSVWPRQCVYVCLKILFLLPLLLLFACCRIRTSSKYLAILPAYSLVIGRDWVTLTYFHRIKDQKLWYFINFFVISALLCKTIHGNKENAFVSTYDQTFECAYEFCNGKIPSKCSWKCIEMAVGLAFVSIYMHFASLSIVYCVFSSDMCSLCCAAVNTLQMWQRDVNFCRFVHNFNHCLKVLSISWQANKIERSDQSNTKTHCLLLVALVCTHSNAFIFDRRST